MAVELLAVSVTLYSQDTLAAQLFEGVMEPTDPSEEINKIELADIHDLSLLAPVSALANLRLMADLLFT